MLKIKMKKKLMIPILALVLVIAMSGTALAYRVEYVVVANNVHFRESPGTNTTILGIVQTGYGLYNYTPISYVYKDGYNWMNAGSYELSKWGWIATNYVNQTFP